MPARRIKHHHKPHREQKDTTMSFEVQTDNKESNNHPERTAGTPDSAVTTNDIRLALRAKQAALDVVLDGVSIMTAQARLTRYVDPKWWDQTFSLLEDEIPKLRAKMLEGASFEELVFAADEAGETITALAARLGVSIERIADVLDRSESHVNL